MSFIFNIKKKLLCFIFGHYRYEPSCGSLRVYSVGPTYNLEKDKIAQFLDSRHGLGVTVSEYRCARCGELITEKM